MVRAFIAIELPEQATRVLAGLVDTLDSLRVRGLRTVRLKGIHLTLKFLGDVGIDQVGPISDALSAAAEGCRPFEVELGSVGVFPSRSEPRVLWVGIGGDVTALLRLHGQVEEALDGLGFPRDRRAFSPHLTVARIRDRTPSADRQRAADALYSARLDSGVVIPVREVVLIQSVLHPDGARYRCISAAPLAR